MGIIQRIKKRRRERERRRREQYSKRSGGSGDEVDCGSCAGLIQAHDDDIARLKADLVDARIDLDGLLAGDSRAARLNEGIALSSYYSGNCKGKLYATSNRDLAVGTSGGNYEAGREWRIVPYPHG